MIKFQQLKVGDFVKLNDSGTIREGEVVEVNQGTHQVCIHNGVQDFWYDANQLEPYPLDEAQLMRLKFEKDISEDGKVKYKKGAFRIYLHQPGQFDKFDLKYREEVRHIQAPIHLHELQNHFYEMTKVHLDKADFN
ncbi:MAG TPA: hypothetical protein DEU93_02465 [Chitinophagaceae bacterium]|nr:hypothetical protein [Chitinophagaceae bacterium]HML58247.1 hypothetical protein [Ferruginibacter sp.]